ncbi:hypothetical protein EMIHUDRAFT_247056 [Emiliania huxleyi CCMP1516]|uniref:RING-type domain-containing protein n=2 Tax=Emiliania huxleyi TaxID=2903 RepID=A0A0D3IPS1_EMIH1|nr:hypothetical protein EMIHUDRAFT_247056 [Emiliania huxleyi CCMP1516]EOD13256.1 hypothetical protein EMIHUDRAFT_247056 [Emiliania huxleyi CCMP1516]|eukprot:XP_005765685.1 hypothetical protein EMIHUDRAFT_247056 [Emiliania huxleyi CCMP1516]
MGNQASAGRPPQVSPEHLRPSPKVSQRAEFDERALRRAILERRLAPCTRGQDEASPHLDECPICMLNFPGGLNRSSCCKQPICTECYLQVAPRMSSRGVSCPFCKKDNYTVGYFGPPSAAARAKARQEEQLALASARKEPEPARGN